MIRQKKLFGFTLIEIMIVMAIMGILSVLGLSTFQTAQVKARDSKRKGDLSHIAKSLETYVNDTGAYPGMGLSGTIKGCEGGTLECPWGFEFTQSTTNVDEAGNPVPDKTVYMAALPKDPRPDHFTYFYEAVTDTGEVKGYRLYARLENAKDPDNIEYVSNGLEGYSTNCGVSGTYTCNYMIGSYNLPDPTPYLLPTLTPTATATNTPTSTPTNTPTPTTIPWLCYQDSDDDGFPKIGGITTPPNGDGTCPIHYVKKTGQADDCYDDNSSAKPDQTTYFTSDRGDGSFDFNCDGVETTDGTVCYYCSNLSPQIHRRSGGCVSAYKFRSVTTARCGQDGYTTQTTYCSSTSCYMHQSDCQAGNDGEWTGYATYSCSGSCKSACR